jgi:peptide/nickel transport system substrate-binding protein
MKLLKAALLVASLIAGSASAQTLRIGLAEDPDVLDPTLARTFVGRIVFSSLCDKLIDIAPNLKIVPQLATEWGWSEDGTQLTMKLRSGVKFHDGEKLDAQAAKFSLERHLTMTGSFRKNEISGIKSIDVLDDLTFRINLDKPFAPLIAQLTDRAGMMVSPKAAQAAGEKFGNAPVCAGPFKFVERVAQDRIVVERFDGYWNRSNVHLQKIVFQPITDNSVRLANLKAGQLDFIERVAATDLADVRKDSRYKLTSIVELGYQGITFNVAKGDFSKDKAVRDKRVRQALDLAIDRQALVQVVFNGEFQAGNQWVPPLSTAYAKDLPMQKRDVAKAKALLKEAGTPNPVINLMITTTGEAQQVAQVIQAMAKEAGFDIKLQATEFAAALKQADQGTYEAFLIGWSGRTDPDGNIGAFVTCNAPNNNSGFCDPKMQELVAASRSTTDIAKRQAAWNGMAKIMLDERPIVYLYHRKWFWAFTNKLSGFVEYPDGLVRVVGMKLG